MLKQERKTGKRVAEKAERGAKEKKLEGGEGQECYGPLAGAGGGDSEICHLGK